MRRGDWEKSDNASGFYGVLKSNLEFIASVKRVGQATWYATARTARGAAILRARYLAEQKAALEGERDAQREAAAEAGERVDKAAARASRRST